MAGILAQPARTWAEIARDEPTTSRVLNTHVIPLALVWPVAGSIGSVLFGRLPYGLGFATPAGGLTAVSIVTSAMVVFICSLVSLMLTGLAASSLAPRFGGKSNTDRGFALAAYSATPVFLLGVVAVVPQLVWLSALGLYGVRLIWLGAPALLDVPPARATGFTIALAILGLAMNLLVSVMGQLNTTLIQAMGLT